MSAEQLFRILGLVDEDLIEEAAASFPPTANSLRRKSPWLRVTAAAA